MAKIIKRSEQEQVPPIPKTRPRAKINTLSGAEHGADYSSEYGTETEAALQSNSSSGLEALSESIDVAFDTNAASNPMNSITSQAALNRASEHDVSNRSDEYVGKKERNNFQDSSAAYNKPISSSRKVISGEAYAAKSEAQKIIIKAQAQASQIITQAKEEAAQINEETQTECTLLKDEAKHQGYEEGQNEAAQKAMTMVAEAVQGMEDFQQEAIPQLKNLALTIAKKIIGLELQSSPETVVNIIRQALAEKARQRTEIFLRVHPDDYAVIRDNKARLLEVLSRCKDIAIREDPDVERFGVIIETDAGRIDAQLETQLAVFEKVLKSAG